MAQPLVCLALTGKTLEEDLRLVKKNEKQIDLVELRVDCLNEDDQLYIKRFPSLIYQPCILTIRRDIDGGFFTGGEFSRTNLFGRALAFANPDRSRNFAYVEFEEDYQIPSIQDAAMAFGVKIIRSFYSTNESIINIKQKCDSLRKTGYEIPKVAFLPGNLSDLTPMFKEAEEKIKYDYIISAMGEQGLPARILSSRTGSYLTYVVPEENISEENKNKYIDPFSLNYTYNFRNLHEDTKLFGVAGWPLINNNSVELLNRGFRNQENNSISMPLRSGNIADILHFSDRVGFSGISINEPFNENIIYYLSEKTEGVIEAGTCDTIIRKNNKWVGYNISPKCFKMALEEVLGDSRIRRKKVAILGAGGSARSVAQVLHQMGAKVCIFNRTIEHAQNIAEKYGFKYSSLDVTSNNLLEEYSYLIIQTTTLGSDVNDSQENDPIPFYKFSGYEIVFDLIYSSAITPMLKRASLAGCRTANGHKMLEYKTQEQFRLFNENKNN